MTKLFTDDGSIIQPLSAVPATIEMDHLHALILKDPSIIPGDEVDIEQPCRWLVIGSEVQVPDPESGVDRWAMDVLMGDQRGIPTLVECKRAGSSEIHRQVLGQAIEYAANAQFYWDRSWLMEVANRQFSKDRGLEEALTEIGWTDGAGNYFQTFEKNLKEGMFRIIFVVDSAPYRLRSSVEFLNTQFRTVDALIVEVQRHAVGGSTVISSGVLGYSGLVRAAKRQALRRQSQGSYDDASFLALISELGNSELTKAAESLLHGVRKEGWSTRYTKFGSLLISPSGFHDRTTIGVITAKGAPLEWYVGEFTEREPQLAEGLLRLSRTIGASSAAKYPRTPPEVWTARVPELLAGLKRLSENSPTLDSSESHALDGN